MHTNDPQDFSKVIAKHKQDLAEAKRVLGEQTAMLEELKKEYAKLGVDKNSLPSFEELPKEYQEQYLNFTRELNEIGEILQPKQVKAKPAVRRQRSMI